MLRVPEEHPDKYLDMPKGLSGYWWETEHLVCVAFVASKNEGDGTFGKFLRTIETKGKMIFFPTIISARLEAILRGRGYEPAGILDPIMGFVDGLAKDLKQEMPR